VPTGPNGSCPRRAEPRSACICIIPGKTRLIVGWSGRLCATARSNRDVRAGKHVCYYYSSKTLGHHAPNKGLLWPQWATETLSSVAPSQIPINLDLHRTCVRPMCTFLNGIVKLGCKLKHWWHEERSVALLRLPFPWGNHQLCRLGLPSFLPKLPGCGGSSRRTRNHRFV